MNKDFLLAYSKLLNSINSIKKESDNPYFKSKYADLNTIFEEVKEKINQCGFVLLQNVEGEVLRTRIVHIETGEMLESVFNLVTADPRNMQQLGGAVTYARRYSLLPMLNIETEDDDGNTAVGLKKDFKELETFEDFDNAIREAKSEKALCALWYKWKDRFEKDSDEYRKLSRTSSDMKLKLQNPNLACEVR